MSVFISGFCLLFGFHCFGFCPLSSSRLRALNEDAVAVSLCISRNICKTTHTQAYRQSHTHIWDFLESHCLTLRPKPRLKSWDNCESCHLMFDHSTHVPAMTIKSSKWRRKFKQWIKIRTSQLAADYSPIIISWQEFYFSKWSWEGPIVHQQHRGREMLSVRWHSTCSDICGIFLATQNGRAPAVFGEKSKENCEE